MSESLRLFLENADLGHRVDLLVDNGIDMDVISDLSTQDLIEIGLNLGERKRLQKALSKAARSLEPGPERRQLTVMFIDLVGSTEMADTHDVEDFRTIVNTYQACATRVIQRHEGTVAKYMGDGILAYFGYPSAAEHSAEHAARCGLDLIDEIQRLRPLPGMVLQTRVAAATGKVIVGDLIGEGESQERQVVGDTPNLAARLQGLADPDQMIISESTHQLLQGLFDCQPMGLHMVKGFSQPVGAYAVRAEHDVDSRFRATRQSQRLGPLRGRETELEQLLNKWTLCRVGGLQAAIIVADAGIGKSRLLAELEAQIARTPYESIELFCHPQFKNTALHPLRNLFEGLIGWQRSDTSAARYHRLTTVLGAHGMADLAPVFASIMTIEPTGLYTPPTEAPQIQRAAFAEAMVRLLVQSAQGRPLLILFEDLHWADATTLEVMTPFLAALQAVPALLVATSRKEVDLRQPDGRTVDLVHLTGIPQDAAAAITRFAAGGLDLPDDLQSRILAQAEGNPLFLEELTKSLLESGIMVEEDGKLEVTAPLTDAAIPTTLQDSLMARLDHVAGSKELAQIGAVIGREFGLDLLADVAKQPADVVARGVSVLEQAEIVFPVEAASDRTWIFKHALIQEAAYDSLLKSRRKDLHGLIAQGLERLHPEDVAAQPEVMAQHLSKAGQHRRAIDFGIAAGMGALIRSANAEAVAHGLSCRNWSAQLPEGDDRGQTELRIQALLTPALMQTQGYTAPDVQDSASRALELLEVHGDRPEAFPNLWGLNLFHHVRSERKQARDLAERFVALAERIDDGNQLVAGLPIVGHCSWIEGNLVEAETDLTRAITLYDTRVHGTHGAQYGFDSNSYALAALSQVQWMSGRIQAASDTADQALAHARSLNHANTVAFALLYRIMLKQQMGLKEDVTRDAADALEYCARMGANTPASYLGMIANWARGDVETSLEIYTVHDMLGAQLGMTYYRSLAVDNALDADDLDSAETILTTALSQARSMGEAYWLPQLLRLQARLTQARGVGGAPAMLREAARLAQESGAFLLEALALVDLCNDVSAVASSAERARLAALTGPDGIELPPGVADRLWMEDIPAQRWRQT